MNRFLHVLVNGLSIAYEQAGHGPAVVLLHGFSLDARSWRPQLEGLASGFTVVAWDAPGAGRSSDPPEPFTLDGWVDALAGFLDALGLARVHLVGLSWGGMVALGFHARDSARVASLVLVDTYAGWLGSLPAPAAEQRLAACLVDAALPPDAFVAKYLPTMLGEADRRSPLAVAHAMRDAIPGARLATIPGAGHLSNLERPAAFDAIVLDHLLTSGAGAT